MAKEHLILAVDGCGLPTYAAPLHALATAYATLAGPGSTWEATEARAHASARGDARLP